jgi:hypothetical protein
VMRGGWLLANAVALLAVGIWLGSLALPYTNAVRLRNAFLLRRGHLEDFTWTPENVPPDFLVEVKRPPANIEAELSKLTAHGDENDWQRTRELVSMLVRHWRYEGGIQADLATTFSGIRAGGGYCSDYVRVFLAAAHGVGLFCRQWAFSFDGFGGHGHTFVEVFDRQRRQWVFLDVHNNVYAVERGCSDPLDALAIWERLQREPSSITFMRAGSGRLGFPDLHKLLDYYQRGGDQWYLWWGNDVISRDERNQAALFGRVSGRLAHWVGSALGSLPALVVLVTPQNLVQVERMERLRRRAVTAVILAAALVALLVL